MKPTVPVDVESLDEGVRERFWAKVERGAPDECWPWTAAKNSRGYGLLGVAGRVLSAHRLAYIMHSGADIPRDRLIRHTCHRRECVNAAHLRLGTIADNARDMVDAGRSSLGIRNGKSKMTPAKVLEVRRRIANGETFSAVARDFDIHAVTARDIALRRLWRHVQEAPANDNAEPRMVEVSRDSHLAGAGGQS